MPRKQQKSLTPATSQCHRLTERLSSVPVSPATLIQQSGVEAAACGAGPQKHDGVALAWGLVPKEGTQVGQTRDTKPWLNPGSPRQKRVMDVVAARQRLCRLPAGECQTTVSQQGMEGLVGAGQSPHQPSRVSPGSGSWLN